MARMPKISKENLDKFRVVRDEHTRKYLETVPSAVLEAAGLYMEASTGRWLYRAAKNLPRVLETLRQGTPPAVKPSTPSISSRHQNAAVMDWDAESGSFGKPETKSMRQPRSKGRTTGTVPRKKKQQESDRNKAKVQKRKNKRGMY